MKDYTKNIWQYSGITLGGLLIYFLLIYSVGFIHSYELRFLNSVIIAIGLFQGLRAYRHQHPERFQYLSGLGMGLSMALIIAVGFSVFASSFLLWDDAFVTEIQNTEPQGEYLNAFTIPMLIFIETFAAGVLFTYASMQWLKQFSVKPSLS